MDDRFIQPDGEAIRRRRQNRFWSQEQLADAAGLRKRTVERAEAGARLQRSSVQALAQALGCPPDALVRTASPVESPQDRGPVHTSELGAALPPSIQVGQLGQAADHGIHVAGHGTSEAEPPQLTGLSSDRADAATLSRPTATEPVHDRTAREPHPTTPLIQQVAYETLPQESERVVHVQAAEALIERYPDRLEDMAYHAFQGEVWDKAVACYWQAAEQAAANGAYRQAVAHLEQALTSIGHLPGHDDTQRRTIDLQFDLSNALVALGGLTRALDYLREAASLAETLDDGRRLGQACALLSFAYGLAGAYPRANATGRRALAIAEVLGDFTARIRARLSLGQVSLVLGDYAQARDCFRQNIACLSNGLRYDLLGLPGLPAVLSQAWLGCGLAEVGAFAEGQAYCEEALRMAEAVNQRFSLVVACYGVGVLSLYQGNYAQATHSLERGLTLCQSEDLPVWFPWIASSLGAAYAGCGRVAAALPLLEQAVERAGHIGSTAYQARRLAWLGEAYLLAGRLADAVACAERALTLARELQEPSSEGQALWLRAEIAAHRVPPEREAAEEAYHQAQVLAEAYSMRPLLAHCHLSLGTLYEALDQSEPARRELSLAAELFHSMDMVFWLCRTEATLTRVM